MKINESVLEYIQRCYDDGFNDEAITNALLQKKYREDFINFHIAQVFKNKIPKPHKRFLKEAFLGMKKNTSKEDKISKKDKKKIIDSLVALQEIFEIRNTHGVNKGKVATKKDFEEVNDLELLDIYNAVLDKLELIV